MNDELKYYLFGEKQDQIIEENIDRIKEQIAKQQDVVSIDVREVFLMDLVTKQQDPTYLEDKNLIFTDTGIKTIYATPKLVETIKDIIPRNVKQLTLPSEFFTDITYLQEFPNLVTLIIPDYPDIPLETIQYIEQNTNIDNIIFKSSTPIKNLKGQSNFNMIDAGNIIAQYGMLTLFNSGYNNKWKNVVSIYPADYSKKNISTIEALYDEISPYLNDVKDIRIYQKSGNSFDSDIHLEKANEETINLNIENLSPTEANNIFKMLKERFDINNTEISLQNESYEDIYQLKGVDDSTNLEIRYYDFEGHRDDCTYDEFIAMRATIDYYKELIESADLSPVERAAYVYDILKTMRYQENEENKSRAREVHAIVEDGNIVCVGYSRFAEQLLRELDVKCIKVSTVCKSDTLPDEHHARNFIRIDDDKYNIHGLYAMDITWDSAKDIVAIEHENQKLVVSNPSAEAKVVDKYDSLALYRHFLTPMSMYEQRYPKEENPSLYEDYKAGGAQRLAQEANSYDLKNTKDIKNLYSLNLHQQLFGDLDGEIVQRYVDAEKPSLETFREILSNVRKAQGYNEQETKEEVDRVTELHQMINDQNPNRPNLFFESSKTK